MADKKISALTAASTPLGGTEVLPIVQSSATVKVSVANLTAGRTFEALGMTLTSTDAGAAEAPTLDLYRDSATPAASDTLAEIQFNGEDSAGNKQKYACIHGSILSPTSTAEAGQIHFETATAGASTEKMIIGTTNLVINDIGAVYNVRIEGDADANLFYTDATNDRIGVGTVSPAQKLHVVGNIQSSGNTIFSTSGKGNQGTTTNDNADAGVVGEYIEATFNSVTVTTAPGNMTSISLTAGDWDVSFRLSSGGAGATCTSFQFGINTVSATLGTQGTDYLQNAADVVNGGAGGSFPVKRISIASTTTVYGVASTAAGTMTFTTGVLYARRVR
jgi:hypothetical protein